MTLFRCLPTLIEIALVIIFRSHDEIEIGLQFFNSCLSLPALGINDITLSDWDSGKCPIKFEYSHAPIIIGNNRSPYTL